MSCHVQVSPLSNSSSRLVGSLFKDNVDKKKKKPKTSPAGGNVAVRWAVIVACGTCLLAH